MIMGNNIQKGLIMNKTQKIKRATYKTQNKTLVYWIKKILLFPWRVIKAVWRFICRVCKAIWNWLKSIDVVGMVNLTLLVVIIILFSALIIDFVRCSKCPRTSNDDNTMVVENNKAHSRKVVKRGFTTTLPVNVDKKSKVSPKIKTVGVDKPQVVTESVLTEEEVPQQNLSGNVIVDVQPNSPILYNGVKINGNLIIQNMRKYTLPCGTKINGHLFIRNVTKLYFCGEFTVNGNIYVNRQSSFGPLPNGTKINGQIIL